MLAVKESALNRFAEKQRHGACKQSASHRARYQARRKIRVRHQRHRFRRHDRRFFPRLPRVFRMLEKRPPLLFLLGAPLQKALGGVLSLYRNALFPDDGALLLLAALLGLARLLCLNLL
jgi:hypothetical protein